MAYFMYGETELNHLKSKDKKLASAIDRLGFIEREVRPDIFYSLCNSIISQQISTAAAASIQARVLALLHEMNPPAILAADPEALRACGLSVRKVQYIIATATAVHTGTLDLEALRTMPDQAVIDELIKLPGIGVWTAEMLLLFTLQRPNIVSYGDLAIRRGMMNLYGLKELPKEKFMRYCKRYAPYGSVASIYLWALS
ncbi:DNA-3-methyladenine glycosylase [Ruminococcaceae bacterium OttesenSCG-928-N02]|nr:DNA-3-methyladenine glycosylase [Ruminococcaceae bacterium OttesenSCG-928-N02]